MNASSLLADLTSRDVEITLVGDDIQVQANTGEITQVDIQAIREHKVELLNLLADSAVPSHWEQYHDAIASAFAIPTSREEIGPLWMTDPDGWDLFERESPGGLCAPRQQTTCTSGVCTRCGSDQFEDVLIHDGQSIRRDCAKCGKFIDFLKWTPEEGR